MVWRLLALMALALAPASAGAAVWREVKSEHFTVYGKIDEQPLLAYATKLEKFDAVLRMVLNVPEETTANPLTVLIVADTDDVVQLTGGKDESVAGFYVPSAAGSFAVVPKRTGSDNWEWGLGSDTVLYHEYAHHFMLQYFPAAYPMWFVEGFAEFVSTLEYDAKGQAKIGMAAMARIPELVGSRPIPAEIMLANDWDAVKPYHIVNFYSRSWLLTHELWLDKTRKAQLSRYLLAVNEGKPGAEAAAVFGDLAVLDKELAAKIKRRVYLYQTWPVPIPPLESITVRTMTPAESELWAERLAYAEIVGGKKPPKTFVPKVEAVAAKYPTDPLALKLLAAARYDNEDYAGSEQAADRWLAIAPNESRALLAKGKARLALVDKMDNPTAEQWKEARSWIVKANRADGNDPLAYIAYFESFVRAGEKPRDTAVQGLQRALELAPQDVALRINLSMQYANSGKFDEAAAIIRPLAFSPHVSGASTTARTCLVAFEARRMPSEEDFKKADAAAKEGEKDGEGEE